MIQQAIGVALKVIELSEVRRTAQERMLDVSHSISTIKQGVKELRDSVCHLLVDITHNNDEVIAKAAKSIERGIKDLLRYAQVPNLYYETI